MNRRQFIAGASAMVVAPAVLGKNSSWPTREIRMLHPFTAGDQTDISSRLIAEGMSEYLGVPIIVENRPGAGGVVSVKSVGAARPDGYTIGYISNGNVSLDAIYNRYDLLAEIDPILRYSNSAQTIYAPTSKGFKSLKDLIKHIQDNPNTVSVGVGGLGTPSHVMWELLSGEFEPNLKVNVIPFKSANEATQAMLGGHIDAGISFLTGVVPFIQAPGQIDVLALSTNERIPLVSQIPTIKEETGLDFTFMNWAGMCVTKGTPREIQEKIYAAVAHAVKSEKYKQFCETYGAIIDIPMNIDEFRASIVKGLEFERALAKEKGINAGGI